MSEPTKPAGWRRKPVQDRSRHTVDSILEAATRIFEHGTATTNGIAKLAGVSIGSLYESFPNKEAILGRLFEAHIDEAVDALAGVLDSLPPEETPLRIGVRHMVEQLLELHEDQPGVQRVFLKRLAALPVLRTRVAEAERRLRGLLQAWLALHPEVAVPDVELATRIMLEGSNTFVHGFVARDEGVSAAMFVDEVARLWTGYLRGASDD